MDDLEATNTMPRILSEKILRRAMIVLSVAGLLVALYLVYIKFFPASLLCVGAGGCESVNTSVYSEIKGIPVAAIGALGYLMILVTLLLEPRSGFFEEWGPLVAFGLSLVGFLYSAYLTYLELAVIHAICPYCVTSAIVMTVIFVISAIRLRKYV